MSSSIRDLCNSMLKLKYFILMFCNTIFYTLVLWSEIDRLMSLLFQREIDKKEEKFLQRHELTIPLIPFLKVSSYNIYDETVLGRKDLTQLGRLHGD